MVALSYGQQATTMDQAIGSWKVLSLKATTGSKISYPLGEKVEGYVTITSDRIWLLFVDSTRKAPATAALTDAESIAMMKSHVAWTGKYVTRRTVLGRHQVDGPGRRRFERDNQQHRSRLLRPRLRRQTVF